MTITQDYYILDGRAHADMDRALVLESCEGIREARRNIKQWPADSVIAMPNDKGLLEIVEHHPDWKGKE